MKCPNCKSENTEKKEKRDDNGIMGPGFSSWIVDSWWSCKDCGIRFDVIEPEEKEETSETQELYDESWKKQNIKFEQEYGSEMILKTAVSTINKILVSKEICTENELKEIFTEELKLIISKMTDNQESYGKEWKKLNLMVHPGGAIHFVGGDIREGEGDQPFEAVEILEQQEFLNIGNHIFQRT